MDNAKIMLFSSNNIKNQTNKVSTTKTNCKNDFKDVLDKEISEKDKKTQINKSPKDNITSSKEENKCVLEKKNTTSTIAYKVMDDNGDAEDKEKLIIYETTLVLIDQLLMNIKNTELTNEKQTLIAEDIQLIIDTLNNNNQDIKLNYESLEVLKNLKSSLDIINSLNNSNENLTFFDEEFAKILESLKRDLLKLTSNVRKSLNLNSTPIVGNIGISNENEEVISKDTWEKFIEVDDSKKVDMIKENPLSEKKVLSNKGNQTKNNSGFTLLLKGNSLSTNYNNTQDNEILDVNNFQGENILKNNVTLEINRVIPNSTNNLQTNILNQIIESAKMTLSEEVSEMAIKLKPDNLGKVSLKLVLERGMIIAKFDVENHIVKQTLEANLEDLKSSLAEKGYQIKEFNVSVNKDSRNKHNFIPHSRRKQLDISKAILEDYTDYDYIRNHYSLVNTSKTINILA